MPLSFKYLIAGCAVASAVSSRCVGLYLTTGLYSPYLRAFGGQYGNSKQILRPKLHVSLLPAFI